MTIPEWEDRLRPSLSEVIDIICEYIPEDGHLLDVGANVGLVTEEVIKRKPGVVATLFEPVKQFYDHCREKFDLCDNVGVFNYALSNEDGKAFIIKDDFNYGYNQITKNEQSEQITLIKFDTFLSPILTVDSCPTIDFIKIDTEGHEIPVIEGMFKYLFYCEKLPVILMEKGWDLDKEYRFAQQMEKRYGYKTKIFNNDILFIP